MPAMGAPAEAMPPCGRGRSLGPCGGACGRPRRACRLGARCLRGHLGRGACLRARGRRGRLGAAGGPVGLPRADEIGLPGGGVLCSRGGPGALVLGCPRGGSAGASGCRPRSRRRLLGLPGSEFALGGEDALGRVVGISGALRLLGRVDLADQAPCRHALDGEASRAPGVRGFGHGARAASHHPGAKRVPARHNTGAQEAFPLAGDDVVHRVRVGPCSHRADLMPAPPSAATSEGLVVRRS